MSPFPVVDTTNIIYLLFKESISLNKCSDSSNDNNGIVLLFKLLLCIAKEYIRKNVLISL